MKKQLSITYSGCVYELSSTQCACAVLYCHLRSVRFYSLFYQLDAQILCFNTFITFLYMFPALMCSKRVEECNKCIKTNSLWFKLVKKRLSIYQDAGQQNVKKNLLYLSILSHKDTIFGKKVIENKMWILVFFTAFPEIFLILIRI